MLWILWYGFSRGSQRSRHQNGNGPDCRQYLYRCCITHLGVLRKNKYEPVSRVGFVTDTIADLSSLTPALGSAGPIEALVITTIASVLFD